MTTETLFINSKFRTISDDPINNFKIKLNKTYQNVKQIKLKNITMMNSWYNVTESSNKIYFNFGGDIENDVTITIQEGFYSIPGLFESIINAVNSALDSLGHSTVQVAYNFEHLTRTSKLLLSINSNTIDFSIDLTKTTINRDLLGFFDNDELITSSLVNGYHTIYGNNFASIFTDDYLFIKINEFQDNVHCANNQNRYTFVIQNNTDKLDNLIFNHEQYTKPVSSFNELTVSVYNEKHKLIELRNDYSFVLELTICYK